MPSKNEKRDHHIVVVDREQLAAEVERVGEEKELPIQVSAFDSVLELLGDEGPGTADGLVCSVKTAGPFLDDLLKWTEREGDARIPCAVFGGDGDESAVDSVLGKDHVRWFDAGGVAGGLKQWLPVAVEVADIRRFYRSHMRIAQEVYEGRTRLFRGDLVQFMAPEGPPCGPPLPTTVEEIQSLRDARAQFERGLIRAAVRETGSLKDASSALGISYTSLWRRMR